MAGLEADTSSYNQPLPVSPLDMAGKLGSLQQQSQQIQSGAIGIDKQKLDLMNTQFGLMNQELSAMSDDPSITKPQAAERLNRFAKTLNLPPAAVNHMMEELNQAPNVKAFSDNALRRGMSVQEKLNQQYGVPSESNDGATNYQGVRLPASKGGGFDASKGTQNNLQPPVGSEYYEGGQKKTLGPAGPPGFRPAQGLPVAAPQAPGSAAPIVPKPIRSLPVERPVSGATGPSREITDQVPTTLQNRMAAGFNAAPPPMFEEGKKNLNEAQLRASGLNQTNKPAIQALNVLKDVKLSTGPGTGQINDFMAGLKAFGLVDTKLENDPTAARQELEKKLAQFVGNSPIAGRSDAAQTLAEAGSPNPKKQILPALIKLTRDAVALNRVEAAKALTFQGNDYTKVGEHFANFPQSVDERAFSLDLMEPKERDDLVKKMALQYKNGNASEKKSATKFLDSLTISKKLGFYE
jgi:hypothetical protein